MNWELVVVVLGNLVGFQGKLFYIGYVVVFVFGTLVGMVQKYQVNDHHRMIHNPYSGFFVACFYFVEKRGNFHCNPM